MAETRNVRYVKGKVGTVISALVGAEGSEKPTIMVGVDTPDGSYDVTLYLTQGAMKYTDEKLAAIGFPADRSYTWIDDNPEALRGNAVTVKVYEECYNEKWTTKADISAYKRETKRVPKAMLDALNALRPKPVPAGPPEPEAEGLPF